MNFTRSIPTIVLAAGALLSAVPAAASGYAIGPGTAADFPYARCTLNFVFDGVGPAAGRVFVGTAAHCASGPQPGEEVRMGGDPVKVGDVIGEIAAIGDYFREGENNSVDDDWALVEIRRALHRDVDPAVQGHPEYPTRVVPAAEMNPGDVLQYSGYGAATEHVQPVRESREGQWVGGDDAGYDAFAPLATSGDSGGPVIDVKTGGALGIMSTVLRGFCGAQCTLEGPTISRLVAGAAARGIPVVLRPAGASAPSRPAASPSEPAPAQPSRPPSAAPAPARLRLAGCLHGGRLTLRLRASAPLASARVTGSRRAVVVRGRALSRPIRISGVRGRVSVSARTTAGGRVTARRTFTAC